jgi:hypothetical protein
VARPRLPLTSFERQKIHSARTIAVVLVVVGLAAAAIAASFGEVRFAAVVAAIPLLYAVNVLVAPLRLFWLALLLNGLIPALVGYLLGYPVLGVLVGVGVAGWLALSAVRGVQAVPDTLRPLPEPAVDPEAEGHVAAFEALGFEQVGAYAFDPGPDLTVIATLLLGPRRDEYAVVTDLVLNVVSVFGPRLLITRNSASMSLPPEYLANDLRGAAVDELVESHRRGLELLRARGLTPEEIDGEGLVGLQLSLERRCSDWGVQRRGKVLHALVRTGVGHGTLDEHASGQRIDAWLAQASPAL